MVFFVANTVSANSLTQMGFAPVVAIGFHSLSLLLAGQLPCGAQKCAAGTFLFADAPLTKVHNWKKNHRILSGGFFVYFFFPNAINSSELASSRYG